MAKLKKTSVTESIEAIRDATRDNDWIYDKKTRGAINTRTGQKISRRQRETKFSGLLEKQGFTSFEQKAKARKGFGLIGFKSPKNFPKFSERTFFSRDEMFDFLKSISDGPYIFRVKLTAKSAEDKYHVDENGLQHFYANQLSFQSPSDLLNDYRTNYKKLERENMGEIIAWTLVARRDTAVKI